MPGTHPPELGPATGELGRTGRSGQRENLGLPRDAPSFRPDPDEDHARVLRLREQEEAESAVNAKIFFQLNHAAGAAEVVERTAAPGAVPTNASSPLSSPAPAGASEASGSQSQRART